jgi:hypothetical protein
MSKSSRPSPERLRELVDELRLYHHYEPAAVLEVLLSRVPPQPPNGIAMPGLLREIAEARAAKSKPAPITHVAIKFQGRIWSLPRPYRHHHVLRSIHFLVTEFGEYTKETIDRDKDDVGGGDNQGFLDATGAYLTRKQAMIVAMANGQITKPGHPTIEDTLYSEDVW